MSSIKNIVYISSISWDFSWNRQQEMMSKMVEAGYNVLFVEPVKKKRFWHHGLKEERNRLWVLRNWGLPYERCLSFVNYVNALISKAAIAHTTKKIGFTNYIIWFDRIHGCNCNYYLKRHYSIYDLVDEILAFGRMRNDEMLISIENNVLKNCCLLLSSSQVLMKRKIQQAGRYKESMFLPNGVDVSRFTSNQSKGLRFFKEKGKSKLRLGFVGQISKRSINFDLVIGIAKMRPNWELVFVGPGTDDDKGKLAYENIIVRSAVTGDEIPDVIASFDCGIIPYNVDNVSMDYAFPRKACEYLASGKPVVATPLKEIMILEPYVQTGSNAEQFIQAVENSVTGSITAEERINFVKKYDWNVLMQQLLLRLKLDGV